jgi:HTH-type transcriptional regulator/antitoxin HigA
MIPETRVTKTYIKLLKSFPPRSITSEEELLATQEVIDSLIDKLSSFVFLCASLRVPLR